MASTDDADGATQRLQRDGSSYGAAGAPEEKLAAAKWNLWILVGLLCLAVVAEGYDFGVLNGAIVRIQEDLGLSSLEIAVLVTTTPLFVMPGALLAGWAADAWGRRPTIGATTLVLVAGPLVMAFAPNFLVLSCGRAICGLGIGCALVVVNMYVSEVAPAHQRGQLVSLVDVALNVGMLLGYTANWALLGIENDWRIMLGLGSVLAVVLIIFMVCGFVPESPRWLFFHQRKEEGRAVLASFVGEREAHAIAEAWTTGPPRDTVPWRKMLWPYDDRRLTRQLAAGFVVGVGQTACGYLAVAYYSSKVMKRVMEERTAFLCTMIMGVVKAAVVIGVVLFLEHASRRIMLLSSALVTMCACVLIATAFTLSWSPWALAAGFWLFMAGFSLGLGPITYVYLAEVFPTACRGKGMSLALFASRLVGVATTLAFPLLTEGIGVPTTFFGMAGINLVVMILVWIAVGEVKKTMELPPSDAENPFCRKVS